MIIGKVSNVLANGYPYADKAGTLKKGRVTEDLQDNRENGIKAREIHATGAMTAADVFQMLRKDEGYEALTEKAEEAEKEKTQPSVKETGQDNEESGSKTNIIVKPDGSRVLMITMSLGGMETTMSIEISKPTEMQNNIGEQEGDNSNMPASEMNTVSEEAEGAADGAR